MNGDSYFERMEQVERQEAYYKKGFREGYKQGLADGKTQNKAEWVPWGTDYGLPTYKCSRCGLIVAIKDSGARFCGECGSQMHMKGGDENEVN